VQLLKVDQPKSQPLAEDYTENYGAVASRYDFSPWNPEDWEKRADWVAGGDYMQADRAELVRFLKLYNEDIGNSGEQAARSLERLKDPQAMVVVGGQQAGLFTGPLLVIHKAISIIRSAREASERLGHPVIPVFWIAGEDHDFDEVNHWYGLSPQMTVERWRLEHPTGVKASVSRLPIESWKEALAQMEEWLPQTEFKPELMERLERFAGQSATLTDYFGRIMAWLFGHHGLLLIDSDDARLRSLEAPMFERLLERHIALNGCILEAGRRVREMGYTPQAEQAEGSVNLFFYDERGERLLLQWDGEVFTDRKHSIRYDAAEMERLVREQPERFSNNVMTRPLMQDYLLPVLAVVLGPGELAYWGLTREAFHEAGLRVPILLPRLEFTLVEGTVHKHMEKFGLSYADVMERFEEFRAGWLAGQGSQEVEELFTETKRSFEELYRPVLETVSGLNPGLGKLGETNRLKILEQIEFLRVKAADAMESKFSTGLRQLDRIRLSLAPLSKPQERVYNVFAYLNKYGSGWVDELIREPYPYDGRHRLVYL
jgi:bacillithiol synthase